MTRAKYLGSFVIGLLVLIGAGWITYWILEVFLKADKSIQASIIAGLVALFSVIFTYWKEKTRSISEAHREKKIEIYKIFFDEIFEATNNMRLGREVDLSSSEDFMTRTLELKKGLMSYGSPKVINSFAKWQLVSSEAGDSASSLRGVGDVILAMREDIGLSNRGLDSLTIHQININEDLSLLSGMNKAKVVK